MRHFKVDGCDKMLNNREVQHWCETGRFMRIKDGDDEDVEYTQIRDEMLRNGDGKFYESCCP